jgi:hypothetical protein
VIKDIEAGAFPFDGTWCDFRPGLALVAARAARRRLARSRSTTTGYASGGRAGDGDGTAGRGLIDKCV